MIHGLRFTVLGFALRCIFGLDWQRQERDG
jgi:hypothetical protein